MSLGEPRDPIYNLAKIGYSFFAASKQLVTKFRDPAGWYVEAADVIYYIADYADYCLARYKYWGYLPIGLNTRNLITTSEALHKLIRWSEEADSYRYRKQTPVTLTLDMINDVHRESMLLLSSRIRELGITLNHWGLEFGAGHTQSQEGIEPRETIDTWGIPLAIAEPQESDFTVKTTTNPYYLDLLDYHNNLDQKVEDIAFDLNMELQAVEMLLGFLRHADREI